VQLAEGFCESAAAAAQQRLSRALSGEPLAPPGPPVGAEHVGEHLLDELGAEDSEHPASACSRRPRLQRLLTTLHDKQLLQEIDDNEAPSPDKRRLAELADPTVNSEWLWALSPVQPHCLESDAYVAAARMRVGAGFALEPVQCRVCGGLLGPQGTHATCCAPGGGTRGHNDVRDAVLDLARLADATAEKEVLGLLDTAPGLRPADVLTTAVSPGRTSALDVGVAAVESMNSGDDCTESMRMRKRTKYAKFLPDLEAEGVEYKPLIWSCWGREHPDTTAALTAMARTAARRRGCPSHKPLLRQARAQIGAALARRLASMFRACMPGQ
jgi:hypothetical protein